MTAAFPQIFLVWGRFGSKKKSLRREYSATPKEPYHKELRPFRSKKHKGFPQNVRKPSYLIRSTFPNRGEANNSNFILLFPKQARLHDLFALIFSFSRLNVHHRELQSRPYLRKLLQHNCLKLLVLLKLWTCQNLLLTPEIKLIYDRIRILF